MKKCILCGDEYIEIEYIYSLIQTGYCSEKCRETDKMVLRADCEEE